MTDSTASYEERRDRLLDVEAFPVTSGVDPEQSRDLAHALSDGGLPAVEFAARYDGVMDSIEAVASYDTYDGMVGIGSVQDRPDGSYSAREQVADAIEAGAEFVVSHYAPEGVADVCRDAGIPVVLAAFTPNEIERLLVAVQPDAIKWYPAMAGGPDTLDEITGPLPDDIPYLASGGIAPENATAYVEAGADAVAYGISDVDEYDEVREEARQFVTAVEEGLAARESKDAEMGY